MLVDSHCHLNLAESSSLLDQILENSYNAGVGYMQTICTTLEEFEEIWQFTMKRQNIFCSIGVHPDEVREGNVVTSEKIIELAQREKVVGIGETGLDYYRRVDLKDFQIESFRNHIEASRVTGLPTIIHTRDAEGDTLSILREEKEKGDFPALIHCFTASKEFAKEVLDLDLYISVAGIITFKNAESLREIIKYIPLDRLLIETDSPFLAPVPCRGKVNEPAFLYHIAKFIADLRNIKFEELANSTTNNFFKLFNKAHQIT